MNRKLLAAAVGGFITAGIFTAIPSKSVNAKVQSVVTSSTPAKAPKPLKPGEFDGVKTTKTDAEWKQMLSADEYKVLRQEGTERAYSGEYTENHKHGTYYCRACGLALFKSDSKFDSGTGWPSFFQPIFKRNVLEEEDRSFGETRTKVSCARCHSHLGHVFDDGPRPTGLRYCMNSVSLKFQAD